jgi:sugar porter (SP) family MFS transporter
MAAVASTRLGRRRTLLINAGLYVVTAVLAACAPTLEWLLFARAASGIAVGVSTSLTPMYIAECAPAERRGALTSWAPFVGTLGILSSYLVSLTLAPLPHGWRYMLALGAVPAAVQLLVGMGLGWLPESPAWLDDVGRRGAAAAVRVRLGTAETLTEVAKPLLTVGDSEEEDELDSVSDHQSERGGAVRAEDGMGWWLLLQARHSRVLLVGLMMNVFQQVSGINVLVYFAPKILNQVGFARETAIAITCAIGVAQLASNYVLTRVVDLWGRRPLAFVGLAGLCLGHAALSVSFNPAVQGLSWAPWLGVTGIVLIRISFSISMGPLPYIITAEIFPRRVRAAGVAASSAANWLANFAVSLSFLPLVALLTPQCATPVFPCLLHK